MDMPTTRIIEVGMAILTVTLTEADTSRIDSTGISVTTVITHSNISDIAADITDTIMDIPATGIKCNRSGGLWNMREDR